MSNPYENNNTYKPLPQQVPLNQDKNSIHSLNSQNQNVYPNLAPYQGNQGGFNQNQGQYPPPNGMGQQYYPPNNFAPQSNSNGQGFIQAPNQQGYYQPPPPIGQPNTFGNPPIILINQNSGMCPHCGANAGNVTVHTPGAVTWAWCFCSFWFTGCCCWIPFLVDGCKDVELICSNCGRSKQRVEATCC